MNWKRAFWIMLLISIIGIGSLGFQCIKQASNQIDLSQKLSAKQIDLDIAIQSFNHGSISKDSAIRLIRKTPMVKRTYPKLDTIRANSILLIYQQDSLIKIERID